MYVHTCMYVCMYMRMYNTCNGYSVFTEMYTEKRRKQSCTLETESTH